MSNPDLQVLLQLNQLRRDVAGHDFVWQVLALLLCLGLAYFLAHRWLRWRWCEPSFPPCAILFPTPAG